MNRGLPEIPPCYFWLKPCLLCVVYPAVPDGAPLVSQSSSHRELIKKTQKDTCVFPSRIIATKSELTDDSEV